MSDTTASGDTPDAQVYKHEAENTAVDGHVHGPATEATANAYWKENIRLLLSLLVVWFVVSFGAGILFVDQLNKIDFFGVPLGFWFAQQGSIYVFVVLIFIYSTLMRSIERRHGVDDG